ncbi:hypothetical protein [Synechococcus sp. CCY9202]|uniref:hypothetical protein n=1 Tax=Synechococcus sp. CCY9202 TaxID=174698 RepID=UPI002B21601D|nr:hypothetical protein [Synechococcus sp. CCY9202]MEA5424862.1 hypothetical protein [Synechococcus sp. CCY9202]
MRGRSKHSLGPFVLFHGCDTNFLRVRYTFTPADGLSREVESYFLERDFPGTGTTPVRYRAKGPAVVCPESGSRSLPDFVGVPIRWLVLLVLTSLGHVFHALPLSELDTAIRHNVNGGV